MMNIKTCFYLGLVVAPIVHATPSAGLRGSSNNNNTLPLDLLEEQDKNEHHRALQTLGDWAFCSDSSQCANRCCSSQYSTSDGRLKCTPGGTICVSSTTTKLGDWAFCTSNSQCQNNCCSKQYSTSDGRFKCTPGGTICTGSATAPSPSPPTSTTGTVLYQGSGWGTFYYDVTGISCPGFSSYVENNGYPLCTSNDPAKWKQLYQYGTNNIVAIDASVLGADRAKYCGKEIVIYKNGAKVPGGPYVVFDGCAACQGGLGIDFSLTALNNLDNGNACNDGKVPGFSWQVTTNQIIPFVP